MSPLEIALFAIVYVILGTMALGGISAAPWLPTRKGERERIAALVELKDGQVVYDLGCGDGSVLFALARKNPSIRAVGYEIALLPFAVACAMKAHGGEAYRNVAIRCRDLFSRDVSDADVVFVFLFRDAYPRIMAKLGRELRDDALVVVEAWPMPGIQPVRVEPSTAKVLPIYFYEGRQFRSNAG